jgi:dimeric dUTPase (all-alpha-NTP-PPase superfamily)
MSLKTLMVIQTLFYTAQLGEYGEHFEAALSSTESEYRCEKDPYWKFHHIYSKTNVLEYLTKGLQGLGQISLISQISEIIEEAQKERNRNIAQTASQAD